MGAGRFTATIYRTGINYAVDVHVETSEALGRRG